MSILATAPDSFCERNWASARFDRGGDGVANFVEQFADDRLLFLGERFHLLAPDEMLPLRAEIFHSRGFERLLVSRGFDFAQRVIAQLFQRMAHSETNVERLT